MKWAKFSDRKPPNGDVIIRSEYSKALTYPPLADWGFSFSSGTLWMGRRYALDQNSYEWLDERESIFSGYSIADMAVLKNKIKQLEEALNKVEVQK